jgi:hypothetical protein
MARLNADYDMIERMELDLVTKAQAAFTAAGLTVNVHGVFSIDDLENKTESDLCSKIAIGVGYMGAELTSYKVDPKVPLNVSAGLAAKTVDFLFSIILGVPTGDACEERYNATKLLTALRRHILGSMVSGDRASRNWNFVKESPNISESTKTMLYYSQVWRVAIVEVGPVTI